MSFPNMAKKSGKMQKPGATSAEKVTGATKPPVRGRTMEKCSALLKPVVPKMGTGGIRS